MGSSVVLRFEKHARKNFFGKQKKAAFGRKNPPTFNVSGNTLNAILNQRSQDMLTANNWNVVQYAVLVHMLAQVSGLEAGELIHVIADCHIYDRHVPLVEKLLEREPLEAPKFYVNHEVKNFYDFGVDDFRLENYRWHEFTDRIPVAI